MISAVALARDLYSTLILDLDTVACFFAVHDMRLLPKKIVNPTVDLLSSKHPTQSTSEYPLTSVDDDLQILRPMLVQDLIYCSILLAVIQCTIVGAYKNWQTLFIGKSNVWSGQC
jgi:hypothetical protein